MQYDIRETKKCKGFMQKKKSSLANYIIILDKYVSKSLKKILQCEE